MMDTTELKRLAEAAGSAVWSVTIHDDCEYVEGPCGEFVAAFDTMEGANYMAAANPAAVLELIAENDRLSNNTVSTDTAVYVAEELSLRIAAIADERDQLKVEIDEDKLHFQAMGQALEGLVAERDKFKAELEGYIQGAKAEADAGDEARAEVRALKCEIGTMTAAAQSIRDEWRKDQVEVERLRKDAERLEFCTSHPEQQFFHGESGLGVMDCGDGLSIPFKDADSLRAAIDRVMSKEAGQ